MQFKTYEGDPVVIAMPVNADNLSRLPRLSERKFGKRPPVLGVAANDGAPTTGQDPSQTGTSADAALAIAEEARARSTPPAGEYMPALIKEPGRTLHLLAGSKAHAEAHART